jgi:hypothetical protein
MGGQAGGLNLLDDEAPAGRPLEGDVGVASVETLQPLAHPLAGDRENAAALHLSAFQVERLEGDLLPVHVECAYDLHGPSSSSEVLKHPRAYHACAGEGLSTSHLASRRPASAFRRAIVLK